jgi:uncharacterized protein (DUF1697 family)
MAQLRALLAGLGLRDVATYLQSGNAVFSSDEREAAVLERAVHDAIARELDVDTTVMVRTADELAAVAEGNPWPARADVPKQLHAVFLAAEATAVPDFSRFAPDEVLVRGRTAYVWYAEGAGRSKLTLDALRVEGTARNWTTVLALRDMARATQDLGRR